MNTIRVSNGLDPDQDRRSAGPDLGLNRLQGLSADDCKERVLKIIKTLTEFTGTQTYMRCK